MRVKRLLSAGAVVLVGLLTVPAQMQAAAAPAGPLGAGTTGESRAGSAGDDRADGSQRAERNHAGVRQHTTNTGNRPKGAEQPTADASIGQVDVRLDGEPVSAGPIAPCELGGELSNETRGLEIEDVVEYGRGNTTCARNSDGTATAQTSGRRFELTALTEFGGPRIGLRTYSSSCSTTDNGSSARMEVGGVTGIDVPERIPANYTVYIPGREQGDPPMAKVVVNESVTPDPPNGDLTVNVMRVELFPNGGGPQSGDIKVGTVSCYPFG